MRLKHEGKRPRATNRHTCSPFQLQEHDPLRSDPVHDSGPKHRTYPPPAPPSSPHRSPLLGLFGLAGSPAGRERALNHHGESFLGSAGRPGGGLGLPVGRSSGGGPGGDSDSSQNRPSHWNPCESPVQVYHPKLASESPPSHPSHPSESPIGVTRPHWHLRVTGPKDCLPGPLSPQPQRAPGRAAACAAETLARRLRPWRRRATRTRLGPDSDG
jgi:hypothetical protein